MLPVKPSPHSGCAFPGFPPKLVFAESAVSLQARPLSCPYGSYPTLHPQKKFGLRLARTLIIVSMQKPESVNQTSLVPQNLPVRSLPASTKKSINLPIYNGRSRRSLMEKKCKMAEGSACRKRPNRPGRPVKAASSTPWPKWFCRIFLCRFPGVLSEVCND